MSNLTGKWRDVDEQTYPWLSAFNQIMKQTTVPFIHGDIIYVTSDYSGFHGDSKYTVITILLADLGNYHDWEVQRRIIRERYLARRKMAYKKLNDKQREAALLPFLEAQALLTVCAPH